MPPFAPPAQTVPDSPLPTWLTTCTDAAWPTAPSWVFLEVDSPSADAFMHLWQHWSQHCSPPRPLHAVVALAPAAQTGGWSSQALTQRYPAAHPWHAAAQELAALLYGLLPGVHRISVAQGQVLLTLWVGDSTQHLRQQHTTADAIWLHAPEAVAQPQHWLKSLARHCQAGTQLACAGGVSAEFAAGLQANGFAPASEPAAPSGPAPTLTQWQYAPRWTPRQRAAIATWPRPQLDAPPRTALVVGAGLAGSAAAWSLAQRGWHVTVLGMGDAPADGASGLPAGLFCPHISPDDSVLSRLSRNGVRMTLQRLQQLCATGLDWAPTGVLEHCTDGGTGLPTAWPSTAGSDWSHPATAAQLQQAGLPLGTEACWHRTAGWVRPQQLVRAQLRHPLIRFVAHAQVAKVVPTPQADSAEPSLQSGPLPHWQALDAQGNIVASAQLAIVAAGAHSPALLADTGWPLQAIRGQITQGLHPAAPAEPALPLPPFPVNGNGNFVPHIPLPTETSHDCSDTAHATVQGWIMGSTFERDVTAWPISAADQALAHAGNLAKLTTLLPASASALAPWFDPEDARCLPTWGQVRCASHDRLPVVGPVQTAPPVTSQQPPGLWVLTALGSRGLTLSVLCGELLAAQLHGEPLPLDAKLATHLGSQRMARFSAQ